MLQNFYHHPKKNCHAHEKKDVCSFSNSVNLCLQITKAWNKVNQLPNKLETTKACGNCFESPADDPDGRLQQTSLNRSWCYHSTVE